MVERKFQDGVVGSTNVIEGMVIPVGYEQLVNYIMLYDSGDECTDITGGWAGTTYYTGAVVTKYDTYLHIHSYRAMAYMNNKIDTSDAKAIFVNTYTKGRNDTGTVGQALQVSTTTTTTTGAFKNKISELAFNKNPTAAATAFLTFELTDTIKGNYYYGLMSDDSKSTAYMNVYHVALVKEDDWTTLASKAGITASSIDDILTASSTLLANKDAVNFMIARCTGDFMASFVASSNCLSALESSPYKTLIQSNEHWAKFLAMVA